MKRSLRTTVLRERCFAGAHGGAALADFVQVSALHGQVRFARETGEELFHQQSASANRQTQCFLRDHFNRKSHTLRLASADLKIKAHSSPIRRSGEKQLGFPCRRDYIGVSMSLAEIEAELGHLGPGELRHVALKSWVTFVEKEQRQAGVNECNEDDPRLLAALDEAIAKADATPCQGHSGHEVRARLNEWTTA
jgi:hypothetical protein